MAAINLRTLFFIILFYCNFAAGADSVVIPVKSNLPLILVGTIVRSDETLSLATLRFPSHDRRENYSPGKLIDNLALVKKIEREKMIFINKSNNRLEYIGIGSFDPKANILDQNSKTQELQVERKIVDQALLDVPKLLQEAGTVPVISNGQTTGFKLAYIKPGSLYEKLGLKVGDVMRSVNDTALDSPLTALELFNQLKSSSLINLKIDRAAKPLDLIYLIR